MAADDALALRLRELIRDVPGFPRPGIVFRDITGLLADPRAFGDSVRSLAEQARAAQVTAVAGIESRGFILGGAVAQALGAGFITVRKQGKLPRETLTEAYQLEYGEAVLEVHTDAVPRGERVMLVDDLLATGGTAAAAALLLERAGAVVAAIAFLVELRGLGGAEALRRWPYSALVEIDEA